MRRARIKKRVAVAISAGVKAPAFGYRFSVQARRQIRVQGRRQGAFFAPPHLGNEKDRYGSVEAQQQTPETRRRTRP
jgi:hypothetical protein